MITSETLIKFIQNERLQELFFDEDAAEENFVTQLTPEQQQILGKITLKDWVCNSDDMFSVIHLEDHNVFLMIKGEYDSYGGEQHDYMRGISEVKPEQKTITIYK